MPRTQHTTRPPRRSKRRTREQKFLERVHLNAAGIDIGSGSHWVTVPPDRAEQPVRRKMVALGLEAARARKATATGRGAWWNAGASHMHAAVNNRLLAVWGLLNLLTQLRDLQRST